MGREELIAISEDELREIIWAELQSFFSSPRVAGIALAEHEIQHITGGILLRAKLVNRYLGSP